MLVAPCVQLASLFKKDRENVVAKDGKRQGPAGLNLVVHWSTLSLLTHYPCPWLFSVQCSVVLLFTFPAGKNTHCGFNGFERLSDGRTSCFSCFSCFSVITRFSIATGAPSDGH